MKSLLMWVGGAVSGIALICASFSLMAVQSYPFATIGTPECEANPTLYGCGLPPNAFSVPSNKAMLVWLPLNSPFVMYASALLALGLVVGLPVWLILALRGERRGSSPRAPIMVSALLATGALTIIACILLAQGGSLAAPSVCYGGVTGAPIACYSGTRGYLLALAGAGGPTILGALLLGAPAWVMTLVRAARLRQWGWFTAALFLAPVAPLLYSAFGFEIRRVAQNRPAALAPVAG